MRFQEQEPAKLAMTERDWIIERMVHVLQVLKKIQQKDNMILNSPCSHMIHGKRPMSPFHRFIFFYAHPISISIAAWHTHTIKSVQATARYTYCCKVLPARHSSDFIALMTPNHNSNHGCGESKFKINCGESEHYCNKIRSKNLKNYDMRMASI